MESTNQSQLETPSETIETEAKTDNKKSSKGMLIGMIICAVLAVGGIGFGVYEYLNPHVVVKTESASVVDSAVKAENTQNYIYIGDWGG